VSAAALLALACLAGRKTPPDAVSPFGEWLAAASRPGIMVGVACAALILGAACLRNLALYWLAWRPGRIEVAPFRAGTPLSDVDVDQLTMDFRRRLVTLHLQAPTSVPGAAPEGDFLDVLGRNGTDARNILGTMINVLRAATPSHAYEVRGTLLERSTRPRYGVTVQVLRLPSQSALPVTVWGETWQIALGKAADEATAAIIPQTRRCRAPWGVWRGNIMPTGLLHAFEEGARLEHERRYDEALGAYYRAVEIDPMNMPLRLRIGQLQERLGLYLDALATYWGMWETARPAGARRPTFRGGGRRERSRALLSARYRRNVLLGGRLLAKQWHAVPDPDGPSKRDEQRRRLRLCLRPRLQEVLGGDDPAAAARALAEPVAMDIDRFLKLRELLALYALEDCRRLRRRLRLRFYERATLTCATVKLTEVCMQIRLDWVQHRLNTGKQTAWPPKAAELQRKIGRIERGRPFRRWHEHYNAACAYALPLLVSEPVDEDQEPLSTTEHRHKRLVDLAVCRLQQATARADSAFIASRRDWLLSEDPDLNGLRGSDEFREFEVMYLPSNRTTPQRPRHVRRLESCRYVRALLVASAEQWQGAWHGRARHAARGVDVHQLIAWFDDERRSWEGVRDVALNYRHSASRLALIDATRACADRYAFAPLGVAFPRYADAPLKESVGDGDCEHACETAVSHSERCMRRLSATLHEDAGASVLDELGRVQLALRQRDAAGRPVAAAALLRLCTYHAALWQLLGQWLGASDPELPDAEAEFRSLVEDAAAAGIAELDPRTERPLRAVAQRSP
jgi:hypothetical protein